MPFLIPCSACSTKVKVKDELVGKAIKCPKCGKVFKALAGEEAQATVKAGAAAETKVAPKPAAPKPPPPAWDDGEDEDEGAKKKPAWDKKSDDEDEDDEEDAKSKKKPAKKGPPPKKRADDEEEDDEEEKADSDFAALLEQTTLTSDTKKHIQSELKLREKGIWVGQPDPKIMTVRAIPGAIVGVVVITVFSIVGSVIGGSQAPAPFNTILIVAIAVLWLFLAIALPGLILFLARKKALGSAYVITNKRCITFLPGYFSSAAVPTSYYPDLIQHMRRMSSWVFGGDAGDIVFRSVTTVTTTHHARGGTSTSVSTTYYGFLGMRNIGEIEERIRDALLRDDDEDDDDDDDDRRRRKKKKKKKRRDDDDDD